MMQFNRVGTLVLLAVVLTFSLSRMNAQQPHAPPASLIPTSALLPVIENPLGPLPTNCPRGPEISEIAPEVGSGIGAYPAWAVMGNPTSFAALVYELSRLSTHASYGWVHKFLWAVRRNYSGPLLIRGANLKDDTPLWFYIENNIPPMVIDHPVTEVNLHADSHVGAMKNWQLFPGSIFIPKAGCYYLEVVWEGGSWKAIFPAGSLPDPAIEQTGTAIRATQTASAPIDWQPTVTAYAMTRAVSPSTR
jgi:hypothetical protein